MKASQRDTRISPLIDRVVYGSYFTAWPLLTGKPDRVTRDISITKRLLDRLELKCSLLPRIVVAGSKGKGSTSAFIASILGLQGHKVGLITSPDLRRFEERIRIDGRSVSRELVEEVAREISPAVEEIAGSLKLPSYIGPGGVILALAWKCFLAEQVDVVVVEAGRGGEFDESSLLNAPVSVLTPVMYEHPDKLGDSIEEITRTKSRIAAPGSCLVVSPQTACVAEVVRGVAAAKQFTTKFVSEHAEIEIDSTSALDLRCNLRVDEAEYKDLLIGLSGSHQAMNGAAAVLAIKELNGSPPSDEAVREGLRRVRLPGRMHVLERSPWVLLDGAINYESARNACSVAAGLKGSRVIAVVAVPAPKDLDGVCRAVGNLADCVILTEVQNPALHWHGDPVEVASKYCRGGVLERDETAAFSLAMAQAGPADGIVLLGTQSFVGRALEFWNADTSVIW